MSNAEKDDKTVEALKALIQEHQDTHKGLGPDDTREWFFELAHTAYDDIYDPHAQKKSGR